MRSRVTLAIMVGIVLLPVGCGSSSSGASGGSSGSGSLLVGVLWEWTGGQLAHPPSLHAVPDPSSYLLRLGSDGSFEAQADCNQIQGNYTLSGQNLSLSLGPSTLAACGPNSLDQTYVHQLAMVERWSLTNGQLALSLKDGDQMFFHES